MPVEMKKEIRKRVACHIGATLEDMRKAESECDGSGVCRWHHGRHLDRRLPRARPNRVAGH